MMLYSHFSEVESEENKSLYKSKKLSPASKYENMTQEEVPSIDFKLPAKNDNEINIKGRHYYIKYDKLKGKYYVRDLGIGYGVFAKIENKLILFSTKDKENQLDSLLLNLGQTYIVISFSFLDSKENEEPISFLTIRIFGKNSKDSKLKNGESEGVEYKF